MYKIEGIKVAENRIRKLCVPNANLVKYFITLHHWKLQGSQNQ